MSASRSFLSPGILVGLLVLASPILAQDPDSPLGTRPYDSYNAGDIDQISTSTGGLSVNIPLMSYPQRGGKLRLSFALHYENRGAYEQESCYLGHCTWYWLPRGSGFETVEPGNMMDNGVSGLDHGAGWVVHQAMGADGSIHSMGVIGSTFETLDGTGIQLNSTGIIVTPDGVRISAPGAACNSANQGYYMGNRANIGCESALREDPNGNKISFSSTSGWTDTIGRLIPVPATASTSTCPSGPLPVASAQVWNLLGPSGGTSSITLCYASVSTTYGYTANGGSAVTTNISQLQTAGLPNGTDWTFAYDSAGNLSKITFPTGGTLAYTWTSFVCATVGQAEVTPAIATRTLNDGVTGNNIWTYTPLSCSGTNPRTSSMAITDPLGNDTIHNSSGLGATNLTVDFFENQTLYYQGSHTSGTLLKTVNTTYSSTVVQLANTYPSQVFQVLPTQATTIWANNQQTSVVHTYDTGHTFTCPDSNFCVNHSFTYGRHIADNEYDVGTGAPGALLRTTTTNYLAFANSNYLNNNMLNLLSNVTISNGQGVQVGYTSYAYDSGTRVASGITTQRDTSPPTSPYFGNLSVANRWESGTVVSTANCPYGVTNGSVTSAATFFDTGTTNVATDACGHATTYSYSSSFAGAYPTTVTNALGQSSSKNFDFNTGLTVSTTDPNNQTTSYTYDVSTWRLTQTNYPDLGQRSLCYTDISVSSCYQSGVFKSIATQKMNSSQSKIETTVFDGLGRPVQIQLNSDPEGVDYTVTTYDGLGRVSKQYNPTRCSPPTTSCGEYTWGYTSYASDALGRTTSVTAQDGSVSTTSYAGTSQTQTDPAGVSRKLVSDGLGRVVQVFENPAVLNFETDYAYDALDDLLCVAQKGTNSGAFSGCGSIPVSWRPRLFTYDSLSHLTSSISPESNTVVSTGAELATAYSYDANGNLSSKTALAPNQQGTGTVTTSYTYDALDRVTQKSYSDGTTPTAQFSYDQTYTWGMNLGNPIGRQTTVGTLSGTTYVNSDLFSYDAMGRVILYDQCVPMCQTGGDGFFPVAYAYDLAGDPTSAGTANSGVTFSQSFDAATRPTQLTSSLVDSQHPATLAATDPSIGFYPTGHIRKMSFGNGLTEAVTVEARLQPCRINLNSSGSSITDGCADGAITGTIQDFDYAYGTWGSTNNGNVTIMDAGPTQSFGRTYTYDSLNRLSALSSPSDPGGCTGLSWAYDAWGNRTAQTTTGGSCPQDPSTTFATSNRFPTSPYVYDSAGNVTADGRHTYTYDAENRLTQVDGGSTAIYVYDANGKRVQSTVEGAVTDYIYNLSGNVTAELTTACGNPCWSAFYAYLGSRSIAEYKAGTTYFFHPEHLGSSRLLTGMNQSVVQNLDYLPFGELNSSDSGVTTHKFTGKERDSESGLDNFGTRYYSSSVGRWLSPDAVNLTDERVQNPVNTLNKYAYGGNNPLKYVDPDGRDITVFYTETGRAGHFWMVAYDQSTGKSAVMDFGPQDHNGVGTMVEEGLGMDVPGDVNYQNHMTADEMKQDYSSLTIQTNPEDAQKAIEAINAFNSSKPDYNLYGNNCSTVCRDVLHKILKLDSTSYKPGSVWADIYKKWSKAALTQKPGSKPPEVQSKHGKDYGQPRYGGMDPFDFAWLLLHQQSGCVTTFGPDGHGGSKPITFCDPNM